MLIELQTVSETLKGKVTIEASDQAKRVLDVPTTDSNPVQFELGPGLFLMMSEEEAAHFENLLRARHDVA